MVNNNHPVDLPKTYTVSYFDEAEWNKDLTPVEIERQQEITDLQNQLIGEKGYGPCYSSNPDCTCYTNSGWIQLYVGCLANGCPNKSTPSSWVHAIDGHPIYISTELQLKCISCNSPDHIKNWRFKCSSSNHPGSYQPTSIASFNEALSFMSSNVQNRVQGVRSKMKLIIIKMMDEQGW
jgi:hypothetical protein